MTHIKAMLPRSPTVERDCFFSYSVIVSIQRSVVGVRSRRACHFVEELWMDVCVCSSAARQPSTEASSGGGE